MRLMSNWRTVLTCVLAAASMAGCQSEGLTKQQLVARGDQICKETAEELNPLFAKLFPTGNETPAASEAASSMNQAAELVRREADSIGRLRPEQDLQEEFGRIVAGLRESARLTEESARIASQGDTEGYLEKLQEANRSDQDTRDLMVKFGFRDCAGASG